MNVSTRLILLLTVAVNAVMATASYLMLRQSENRLIVAAQDEVRAHAFTLRLALEEDYQTGRALDAQRIIDRLGGNKGVYGVLLFDSSGQVKAASNSMASHEMQHAAEARAVVATGRLKEVLRRIDGQDVFSVIQPLEVNGERVGAVEVAQEISFIRDDIGKLRRDMAITTLILCATVFFVVWLGTRLSLARRINELLEGAVAVGKGNLQYRVAVSPGGGEFTRLAAEFNRMADSLAAQRRAAEREAEERLELERRLRHSERLAAVGQLAAGVAHEIGAPLQVIDGRAKQLLNNTESSLETRQRNLTIIRTQAERITRLVRQLLNLARPYNLNRRAVALRELSAGVLELLETNAARQGVVLELIDGENVTVQADPDLLHQALLNVCANGFQAMSAGGRLRVECVASAAEKDGRRFAAVRVTDTGPGIAPEHLPRLFEPFFTTKEIGMGTGLGLPVAGRIVEEHGGWIEAANRDEGGAVFTIYLLTDPQTTETS